MSVKQEEGSVELQALPDVQRDVSETSVHSDRSTSSSKYWQFKKGRVDRRFMIWLTQVVITLSVLVYCMFMLTSPNTTDERTIWISLLSAIVGNFLPSGTHVHATP